jgi:hypothetical protein
VCIIQTLDDAEALLFLDKNFNELFNRMPADEVAVVCKRELSRLSQVCGRLLLYGAVLGCLSDVCHVGLHSRLFVCVCCFLSVHMPAEGHCDSAEAEVVAGAAAAAAEGAAGALQVQRHHDGRRGHGSSQHTPWGLAL